MKKRNLHVVFSMVVIGFCQVMSLVQPKCSPICSCTKDTVHCYYTTLFRIPKDLPSTTKIIRFHNNRMLRLTAGQLQTFSDLRELYLPYNDMTAVDRHAFRGLRTLRILNISHNALETIHNTLFADLTELRTVDLSYNRVQTIHNGAFENLKNLRTLSLESNQMTHISSTLLNISSLQVLHLGRNSLKKLQPNTFTSLPYLVQLTLNEVNLMEVPEELFTPLTNLKMLSLSGNQIAHLRVAMFDDLRKLRYIYLAQNLLVCDCALLELRSWMTTAMAIKWSSPTMPTCNLHKIGYIKLTNLVMKHFVNCTVKYFKPKRKMHAPPNRNAISEHRTRYPMPYDPRMGVYTAVVLSSMLVAFLICVAYYKVKKRVKRRIQIWKAEQELKKFKKEHYMQTSTSDNSDPLKGHCQIETLSIGSDSAFENGGPGSQGFGRSRWSRKPEIYIQETVV